MEPPIVRKELCKQIKCDQAELDQFLAILAKKADKMNQKLSLKSGEDDVSDSSLEEIKEKSQDEEVGERQIAIIDGKSM